jgi:hypothetical protein
VVAAALSLSLSLSLAPQATHQRGAARPLLYLATTHSSPPQLTTRAERTQPAHVSRRAAREGRETGGEDAF